MDSSTLSHSKIRNYKCVSFPLESRMYINYKSDTTLVSAKEDDFLFVECSGKSIRTEKNRHRAKQIRVHVSHVNNKRKLSIQQQSLSITQQSLSITQQSVNKRIRTPSIFDASSLRSSCQENNGNYHELSDGDKQFDFRPFRPQAVPYNPFPWASPAEALEGRSAIEFCKHSGQPNTEADFTDLFVIRYKLNPIHHVFNVRNFYAHELLNLMYREDFFHAAVASIEVVKDSIVQPLAPSKTKLAHKGKALIKLREKIAGAENQNDDLILVSMHSLSITEECDGDLETSKLHRTYIDEILKLRGGISSMKPVYRNIIENQELFYRIKGDPYQTLSGDFSYNPIYPRYPLSTTLYHQLAQLPSGIQDLVHRRKISYDVLNILFRLNDLHRRKLGLTTDKNSQNHLNTSSYDPNTSSYDLFRDATGCLGMSDLENAPIQELLCWAIFLYAANGFGEKRTQHTAYRMPRQGLTAKLHATICRPEDEIECLIWIWIVTIDSWRLLDGALQSEGVRLMQQFKSQFVDLREDNIDEICWKFFWFEDMSFHLKRNWTRTFESDQRVGR